MSDGLTLKNIKLQMLISWKCFVIKTLKTELTVE